MAMNLRNLHEVLVNMGYPVEEVVRQPDGQIVVRLTAKGSDAQQQRAQRMVTEYTRRESSLDLQAFAEAFTTAFDALPTVEAIQDAKKLDEVRGMALALRSFIDRQE